MTESDTSFQNEDTERVYIIGQKYFGIEYVFWECFQFLLTLSLLIYIFYDFT